MGEAKRYTFFNTCVECGVNVTYQNQHDALHERLDAMQRAIEELQAALKFTKETP